MKRATAAAIVILMAGQAFGQGVPTRKAVGVDPWLDAVIESAERIAVAVRAGDAVELRRQDARVHQQLLQVMKWPEHAAWRHARAYCTLMTQELANFLADIQKGTAQGKANAQRSFDAAEDARKECSRGILSLR